MVKVMRLCRVIGNVWATRKEETMKGQKLLIVKQVDEQKQEKGTSFIAVDNIGAGIGELVLVTTGSSARKVLNKEIPVDAAVIGIVDSLEVQQVT
jgi:ethanolamine utilization protein EutN